MYLYIFFVWICQHVPSGKKDGTVNIQNGVILKRRKIYQKGGKLSEISQRNQINRSRVLSYSRYCIKLALNYYGKSVFKVEQLQGNHRLLRRGSTAAAGAGGCHYFCCSQPLINPRKILIPSLHQLLLHSIPCCSSFRLKFSRVQREREREKMNLPWRLNKK